MSKSPEDLVGQQVGDYRLIDWLGRGGFADVYLGEHIYLKTQGAIKMLHVQLSEKARKDFLNEARTIARLKHPNIIRLLDYGVENGNPFLVVTYAPNGSLRQWFPSGTPVPPEQIVAPVQQIASALDYAHRQRLIHRDVKPANMLLGPQNEVLLSDFGLAVVAQSTSAQIVREVGGTVAYMAPEQLQGKARFASDQYALGVVTYQWLCGQRPFSGSLAEIASQHMIISPPSLREKVPRIPAAVERVVFKALAKKPNQRYENVTAFANALENACKDSKLTATHIFAVQLPSPSVKTSLPPAEAPLLPLPIITPMPQRQRSQHLTGIWRTMLVIMTIAILIAGSLGLWYGITHSPIQHTPAGTVKTLNAASTGTGASSTSPTPDCLIGSPSSLTFPLGSQPWTYYFQQSVTLTNCGGSTTAWSSSAIKNEKFQLTVAPAHGNIALDKSKQVQVNLNLYNRTGTYQETITFTKGSASWTLLVSWTGN
jgi:serine/threonine protein kinase